jgi:ribosome-binding factor A
MRNRNGGDDSPPRNLFDRKVKQLCREVYRVLTSVLLDDPILDEVTILDVEPAPDGSRLAVQVIAPAGADREEIRLAFERAKGHLRDEIAAAIQRKRTPDLVFEVMP